MALGQLPVDIGVFARYLGDLTALLDTGGGWCGVFWRRDPEGMRACLEGTELPPWDVVEALLQDLATTHGTQAAEHEAVRARALHTAAAMEHDRRPDGRAALAERLGAMRREQTYAVGRERELTDRLRDSVDGVDAERVGLELAWVRDDRERAAARCAEITDRLAALDAWEGHDVVQPSAPVRPPAPDTWFRAQDTTQDTTQDAAADGSGEPSDPYAPGSYGSSDADPAPSPSPAPAPAARRRPRGARYAGLDDDSDDGGGVFTVPGLSAPAAAGPRGARYAGVAEEEAVEVPGSEPDREQAAEGERAASDAVTVLVRLRVEGRSGEAHALLCEAAAWPVDRLPVLAGALHRAGLAADWGTLLWEAASLPPHRVAAMAGALDAAGLAEDGRQLLRQCVARPAPEVAATLLALDAAGQQREVRSLADAFVRVRTPEDCAHLAQSDPHRLVPLLLDAARDAGPGRHRDVAHALRVAGIAR
ncbi:hypothetical protein ABCR94_29985 [Streptomyces sp. 21So2-11]|uniref:hypothetical protein n=1 Tax=Streptomyces sp. 21So2-11 TaxID=3144408 RepID=UPI00321BE9B5